jgi:hypothetical protein
LKEKDFFFTIGKIDDKLKNDKNAQFFCAKQLGN